MPDISPIFTAINPAETDLSAFLRPSVGVVILTADGRLLLQQRTADAPRYPGFIGTFGGAIDAGETAMQALVREIAEELGATLAPAAVQPVAVIADLTTRRELVHAFFWHDKTSAVRGCYEGHPAYFNSAQDVLALPNVMNDLRWQLEECLRRNLIS